MKILKGAFAKSKVPFAPGACSAVLHCHSNSRYSECYQGPMDNTNVVPVT